MHTPGAKVAEHQPNVRAAERFDLEVTVDLESDHNFYTGLTQNISSGGVFIATHHLRKIGDRITLKFTLPGLGQTACGGDRGALDPREQRAHERRRKRHRHGRPLHQPFTRSLRRDQRVRARAANRSTTTTRTRAAALSSSPRYVGARAICIRGRSPATLVSLARRPMKRRLLGDWVRCVGSGGMRRGLRRCRRGGGLRGVAGWRRTAPGPELRGGRSGPGRRCLHLQG